MYIAKICLHNSELDTYNVIVEQRNLLLVIVSRMFSGFSQITANYLY